MTWTDIVTGKVGWCENWFVVGWFGTVWTEI